MKRFAIFSLLVLMVVLTGCASEAMATTFDSPLPPPPGTLPGPGESALFQGLLMQLISGGLASVVVFWILDKEAGKALVDWLTELLTVIKVSVAWSEVARYTAIALSGLVSVCAYLVGMVFGFVPDPGSVAAWVNLVLWMLGVSFTGSQVLHARIKTVRG